MTKTYSKVQRGQVYWFDPIKTYGGRSTFMGADGKEHSSSIQIGHRPWLVISNNEGNTSSPTCNIVPITLEEKAHIPVHVYFTYNGKAQTILVEQPRTVDCLALKDYIYTVADDVMERVEQAIVIQTAIRYSSAFADNTLDHIAKYLESLATLVSNKANESKQYNYQVKDIKPVTEPSEKPKDPVKEQNELKPTVKPVKVIKPVTQQTTKKPDYSGMSAIEKFNARYALSQDRSKPSFYKDDEKPKNEPTEPTGKRNTWTTETRLQYLKDCDTLSPQEIQKKYNLKNIKCVFQMKYLNKNALIKAGVLQQN